MKKLTVLVGDVHGCLEEFEELLNTIQYDPNQMRLISLGDLMDRGPEQAACVKKVRELGIECIMGNHEEKHIRWHGHEKKAASGKKNPMKPMDDHDSAEHKKLSEEDLDWLEALPVKLHVEGSWWAIHGGLEPRYSLERQNPRQVIRVRYVDDRGIAQALGPKLAQPEGTKYWTEVWNGPESIVYGHCVHSKTTPRLDQLPNGVECIGLDTGCVFGGHLTAMLFDPEKPEDKQFVQVKAKKVYFQGYSDD
jgi:diadenosine tetraphosphatase ApaH/serine/threonine PP2A family protein phosphatase